MLMNQDGGRSAGTTEARATDAHRAVEILDGATYVLTVGEQTTGGEIWPAARALAAFLRGAGSGHIARGARCLELGAGTGWLGMAIASSSSDVGEVVLSEYDAGLEWLSLNVAHNRDRFRCPMSCVECDWQWFGEGGAVSARAAQLVGQRWDLVLGSDLVYNDAGVAGLPRCLAALAHAGCPCVLYAHTLHRFDNCDVEFFQGLHENGLVYRELPPEAPSVSTRGAGRSSPPPFAELFPEQRQAIFRIAPRAAAHLLGGPPESRHQPAAG